MTHSHHHEAHYIDRVSWLRAAVLGANDGIVSTASLLVGMSASAAGSTTVLLAGVAGLVAGAMSMAAGEYVSVSSQADLEAADLRTERDALEKYPREEHDELAAIYVARGLDAALADQVATQLMNHDALAAHARDELQINEEAAQPLLAALSSGAAFTVGAVVPLLPVLFLPRQHLVLGTGLAALCGLVLLGVVSARAGGAPVGRAVTRVVGWGALAMLVTGAVGSLFGV